MITILFVILRIIGAILLCLLGLIILAILLILLLPVTYRVSGYLDSHEMGLLIKIRWLFGLLRIDYAYPKPGKVTAQLLGFTLFDSGRPKKEKPVREKKLQKSKQKMEKAPPDSVTLVKPESGNALKSEQVIVPVESPSEPANEAKEDIPESSDKEPGSSDSNDIGWWKRFLERILAKIAKIRYTFRKFCDRIKDILDNYQYYRDLLKEDDSKALFGHARKRIRNVLKNMRPRKWKAEIEFGTGSPDTTGYALGIYGMFSPVLGKNVRVRPNFNEAVILGKFNMAGYVVGCVIIFNILILVTDRKLRNFIKKLKREEI